MGKGDIKSKKGKIFAGSYGVKRKRKATKTQKPAPQEAKAE
jgi:ribosomal small subunit protein bTHX